MTAEAVAANAVTVTDRWQAMRDAIAQCPGGIIERIICDQRTRLHFCNGYWGRAAECPAGIPNDYGQ